MIRKEAFLNDNCLTELRRIIESSEILKEDDQVPRSSLIPSSSAAAIDAIRRRCKLLARVALASHARSLSSGPRRTKSEDRYAIRLIVTLYKKSLNARFVDACYAQS